MTTITAAIALHRAHEARRQHRNPFYRPQDWDQLDEPSQLEHLGIAEVVADGKTTFNGHRIPVWVRDTIKEHL